MKTIFTFGLLTMVLFTFTFQTAFAQERRQVTTETRRVILLDNNRTTTVVTGRTSNESTELTDRKNFFLTALSFSERNDDPCFVRATFSTWRHGMHEPRQAGTITKSLTLCESNSSSRQGLGVGGSVFPAAIHNLRVGMNRKGKKIKAVTISGSTIDHNHSGAVRPEPALTRSFERPNFKPPWKNSVSCAQGQVAVGVVLHHNGYQYNNQPGNTIRGAYVQGISLRCATVHIVERTYVKGTTTPFTLR